MVAPAAGAFVLLVPRQVQARALLAAKVVAAAMDRRPLGEVTLALRVQDHLLRLFPPPARVQVALPSAPGEIEVEKQKKKVCEDKKD